MLLRRPKELEDINEEYLSDFLSRIENRKLPAIREWCDGQRDGARNITNYLITHRLAIRESHNKKAELINGITKDDVRKIVSQNFSVVKANPECEEQDDEEEIEFDLADNEDMAYVYFLGSDNGLVKIGKAIDLDIRIRNISTMCPVALTLLYTVETTKDQVLDLESHFHRMFNKKRKHGEWFEISKRDLKHVRVWDLNRQGIDAHDYIQPSYAVYERARKTIKNLCIISSVIVAHWGLFQAILSVLPK